MPKRYPGFIGPSYTTQNPIAADDECVNWMPSKIESGTGPASYVYDPAPGFETYCTTGADPIRALFTLNGGSFAVSGEDLYELPTVSGGSSILRATGLNNPDDGLVSIAGNGDAGRQLALTASSQLYAFDLITNTLTAIDPTSVPNAVTVVFQDGYGIALDPNTSTIYLSDLEDFTSWPGDSAQRNDTPDKWVAMIERVGAREVWLCGSQTTSVYYNDGNADFPFVPNPSVAIARGIAAPNSLALLNGLPCWLADDLTVRYSTGYTANRISTHAVEFAISQMTTVSDADAFTYDEQGHQFYVLNFPTANQTWTFDLVSQLWHRRGAWNGLDYDVLPVRCHIYANGAHLVGSRTDGTIYQQSQAFATDIDGVTGIRRMRRAPHLVSSLNRVIYDRFQLHMQVGIGLASGQGSDPQAMLRWSDDGGQSWSSVYSASAGAIGEFRTRVIWRKLGMARDRVFEVTCSDPIPWRLVDAYLDLRVGTS